MGCTKIYANAIAKYNEGRLLDREKIKRLTEADFNDAIKILTDYGYGGGVLSETSYDIDKFISEETARLIESVMSDSPSQFLAKCLTNRFYYSNAKALYKNKFVSVDLELGLYKMEDEELKKAIESGEYSALPDVLSDALTALDERFADTPVDPRLIDLYLTKAMFADNVSCAKNSKSSVMINYVRAEIDLSNILTVLRCKNLEFAEPTALEMLIDGGSIPEDDLISILNQDYSATAQMLMDGNYSEMLVRLAESGDIVKLETETDDYLHNLTSEQLENMLSLSPFLSYFTAKLTEFKTVKMILVCLKNNARDEIRRRLRKMYI